MRRLLPFLCLFFVIQQIQAANVTPENSQLCCGWAKIKDGHLKDVQIWLNRLESSGEVLETCKKENVWLQSAFIKEVGGQFFLIYYWIAEDVEKAREIYHNSSLPIDLFHRECWKNFTEQYEELTPAFHIVNPE